LVSESRPQTIQARPAPNGSGTITVGWLAFEASVLRRLKFRSVAMPFTGEPELGLYLKRWDARVAANDQAEWAYARAHAFIENNSERLTEENLERLLEDLYVPRDELNNPALRKWFTETDAWWFDNLRLNILNTDSTTGGASILRSLALSVGMSVGDYVLSFDDETRSLREPLALSDVFRRAWQSAPAPVNNSQRNTATNRDARSFIAEQHADLLFLRLPRATNLPLRACSTLLSWREEWVRGGDDFWDEAERALSGRLGTPVATKQQYLRFVEELIQTAAHLPAWAIAHTEDGFITTGEIAECVGQIRKVEAIYTKDFSELTGLRASIIVA